MLNFETAILRAAGDEQRADDPDEDALREAGLHAPAQEQSGRHDRKRAGHGHQRLPAEQAQDGVGDEPDAAVDEEVRGEGRPERGLLEISQAQVDDIEGAPAAEQRPDQAAQQPAHDGEETRAAQRGKREHLVHGIDDHERAEPPGQRRRRNRLEQIEPESHAHEHERDESELLPPRDLAEILDPLAGRTQIVQRDDQRDNSGDGRDQAQ